MSTICIHFEKIARKSYTSRRKGWEIDCCCTIHKTCLDKTTTKEVSIKKMKILSKH